VSAVVPVGVKRSETEKVAPGATSAPGAGELCTPKEAAPVSSSLVRWQVFCPRLVPKTTRSAKP
jgi:hypothetical protein